MESSMRPTPQKSAPDLNISLLDGEKWGLKDQNPENFNLLVFYRGLHCPICKKYLQTLEGLRDEFTKLGVNVLAISMDKEVRARKARMDWELGELPLGFGLDEKTARNWGLYLSKGVKEGEPEVFSEPGLFLIDAAGYTYYCAINSNPWGRPYLASFVKAVKYITENNYPARGEY